MQTPASQPRRPRLRVEELHSRTLPAVLDPAAAALAEGAIVSTADTPSCEPSVEVTPADGQAGSDGAVPEPDAAFRCGTITEEGSADFEVTILPYYGEGIPEPGAANPDDVFPWIAWSGVAEDGTLTDPAVTDGGAITDEVLMTGFDPAICYLADFPPEPARGGAAGGDTGSAVGVQPGGSFGLAPEPGQTPDLAPPADEADPAARADDAAGEPLSAASPPAKTVAAQPVAAALPGSTTDAPDGTGFGGPDLTVE